MFTKEEMQQARITELTPFLLSHHADLFAKEGNSLRMKTNHSLSIKNNYCGYLDFGTNEHGNSVDFLVNYLSYTVEDAVFALIGNDISESIGPDGMSGKDSDVNNQQPEIKPDLGNKKPVFPEPIQGPFNNLFAYLMNRGISQETIQVLVDKKLLYQYQEQDKNGKTHANIAFVNERRDWGEKHGTLTFGESFHGIFKNSRPDGFWFFKTCEKSEDVKVAYICEAAIDAISLYEIHRRKGLITKYKDAIYVSIGGVSKQATINRIKSFRKIVIAVDNDDAGRDCRFRNLKTDSIIPKLKDWNDDLMVLIHSEKQPVQERYSNAMIDEKFDKDPELKKVIDEGIAEGLLPVGWTDPFNDVNHAKYMIRMMKMRISNT